MLVKPSKVERTDGVDDSRVKLMDADDIFVYVCRIVGEYGLSIKDSKESLCSKNEVDVLAKTKRIDGVDDALVKLMDAGGSFGGLNIRRS